MKKKKSSDLWEYLASAIRPYPNKGEDVREEMCLGISEVFSRYVWEESFPGGRMDPGSSNSQKVQS